MSNQSLLLFTIGPVKGFIGPSRKMRDLYAGSYILSYLITDLMQYIKMEPGVECIIPTKQNEGSAPNRIVATVERYTEEQKIALGKKLTKHVKERFRKLCQWTFAKYSFPLNDAALNQINHFLETYWVYADCKDYGKGYAALTAQINSVKRVRKFHQLMEPAARKCDLYPQYNALVFKSKADGQFPSFAIPKYELNHEVYTLKSFEGLSSIAFVKRMLCQISDEKLINYDRSITSVAYMLLHNRIGGRHAAQLKYLKDEGSEAIFDLQNGQKLTNDEYSDETICKAKEIFKEIENELYISPYYAIVKLDGDGIGSLYQQLKTKEEHTELSKNISDFAERARVIFKENKGVCIFAGGEDILGFLPLDTLFQAITTLHKEFPEKIKAPEGYSKSLTFSAGIVIAHLMDPLYTVLQRVEHLEAFAKEIDEDKNAYAIELLKRSGGSIVLRNKFERNCASLNILYKVAQMLQKQQFSRSFIQNLSHLLMQLKGLDGDNKENMIAAMIKQVLKRSFLMLSTERINEYTKELIEVYRLTNHGANEVDDIVNFSNSLQVIAFLSNEVRSCTTV